MIIAFIIFGLFVLFVVGGCVCAFLSQWIAEERVRGCQYAKTEKT